MKDLALSFIGKGEVGKFTFKQRLANSHAYLYEVADTTSNKIHYEVFRRKVNKLYDCISYPSSKVFGIWAWTFVSRSRALQKFKDIENEGKGTVST